MNRTSHIPAAAVLACVLTLPALVLAAPPPADSQASAANNLAAGVQHVGFLLHPDLNESSGIVASRRHPGLFWTHNDGGGNRPILYAVSQAGQPLGTCTVAGASVEDWEDLALDNQGQLYLGDIGNNNARRTALAVYQLDEPDPAPQGLAVVKRRWELRFPAQPFDCEALFVWEGYGYLVSKVFNDERARLYRFSLAETAQPVTLEHVARLRVESPVTGADLSPDGRHLGLVAKAGAYLLSIEGSPARAGALRPYQTKFKVGQIEACCFVPEGLLATSETRDIFLFTDEPFRGNATLPAGR